MNHYKLEDMIEARWSCGRYPLIISAARESRLYPPGLVDRRPWRRVVRLLQGHHLGRTKNHQNQHLPNNPR